MGVELKQTLLKKLLEEISFEASNMSEKKNEITAAMVQGRVSSLAKNQDLNRFLFCRRVVGLKEVLLHFSILWRTFALCPKNCF
jgi:hypothetical protein